MTPDHEGDEPTPGIPPFSLIAAARQRWGTRALQRGADLLHERPVLPTGQAILNSLLGGGVPRGALTELLGAPTSGMTTIALSLLAAAQSGGELAAYVDVSATFDAAYAAACGVRLADLLLARPATAIEALELVEALLGSGSMGVLVIDSLAWFVGRPEGDAALRRALRRLAATLPRQPGVLVALTALTYPAAVAKRLRTGGSPVAHSAALRLYVARVGWEHDPRAPGCVARVTVLKQRGAPDGRSVELPIAFPDDWGAL